jgi:hypothetical protein
MYNFVYVAYTKEQEKLKKTRLIGSSLLNSTAKSGTSVGWGREAVPEAQPSLLPSRPAGDSETRRSGATVHTSQDHSG